MFCFDCLGVLGTEVLYWKAWTLADHCISITSMFWFIINSKKFLYNLYGPFPYITFIGYLLTAFSGVVFNLNLQDIKIIFYLLYLVLFVMLEIKNIN